MLYPQMNSYRYTSSLDGLWSFRIQNTDENSTGWEKGFPSDKMVGVPGSFNDQFTDYDTVNHMGIVWYSRNITIPNDWKGKQLEINFEAVNYKAEVFLNGTFIGEHESGYTPFSLPVNNAMVDGENLLVVKIDCSLTPETLPQGGFDTAAIPGLTSNFYPSVNFDFFPYSGINRSVSLVAMSTTRLDSVFIDPSIDGSTGIIDIRGTIAGAADSVKLAVKNESVECTVELNESNYSAQLKIPEAKLWDIGQPNLYELQIEVLKNNEIVDSYTQTFGVRTIRVEGDKLILNNRPIYLKGFGKHEDFPVIGRTINNAVNVRDFELMKWIGANSFRTSHYPFATEMLDLADRLGVLVISESPAVSMITSAASQSTLDLHCQVLKEQIRRDYNHPSVVMWCVANEPHSDEEESIPYFEKVFETARAEDSTRPHMLVMCRFPNEKCHHLCDVVGLNTYPGWYGGGDKLENTKEYFRKYLDGISDTIGNKPLIITEFGAGSIAGLHSLPSTLWTEDYQADLLQANIDVIREKPYIAGEHVWTFSDIQTGQNHFRVQGNKKGVFTRDRQPKAAAHTLRKIWTEK